ncbi:PHF7 protein, partial [Neopipo cinnamomea]|nr:PHF7 protein [Neopipo cinnamomea]
ACLLCQRSEADPDICGEKLQIHGLCAHEFCLVSCSMCSLHFLTGGSCHSLLISACHFSDTFLPATFLTARCCICGQSGATISCCERDCDLSFHLPCAKQGGCVTQFI